VEVLEIMRAFDPEVVHAVWAAIEPRIPPRIDHHPLGCHRPRKSDRDCFEVILVRLVTGCSWEDAEHLCGGVVSDTTARGRRDEWIAAGVFDAIATESLEGYDKVIGLDLTETAVDGSVHKAPGGGEGTGKSPVDRGKLGWKWSIATDAQGIPIGWAVDAANRNDHLMLAATLDAVDSRGLLGEIETMWLDRGYGYDSVRAHCAARGMTDLVVATRAKKYKKNRHNRKPGSAMGLRWPVERTNAWFSNYGQLRRNTDLKVAHRLAQFALVVTLLITAKLIDWRNRWMPELSPIR
jgi:transposase